MFSKPLVRARQYVLLQHLIGDTWAVGKFMGILQINNINYILVPTFSFPPINEISYWHNMILTKMMYLIDAAW